MGQRRELYGMNSADSGQRIEIQPITGLAEVQAGDNLADSINDALHGRGISLRNRDILVVAQKIVSKAEGSVVRLDQIQPSERARQWAEACGKDARVVEIVLGQSKRLVRMEKGVIIAETSHGFICANAGVDTSNSARGEVVLLPRDPDRSARMLRLELEKRWQASLAVIIADTFGRPWREGLVNVALGVSGMFPLIDYRKQYDPAGKELQATVLAVADELASAAELVMGKLKRVPVALIRGYDFPVGEGKGSQLVRPPERDLFR